MCTCGPALSSCACVEDRDQSPRALSAGRGRSYGGRGGVGGRLGPSGGFFSQREYFCKYGPNTYSRVTYDPLSLIARVRHLAAHPRPRTQPPKSSVRPPYLYIFYFQDFYFSGFLRVHLFLYRDALSLLAFRTSLKSLLGQHDLARGEQLSQRGVG